MFGIIFPTAEIRLSNYEMNNVQKIVESFLYFIFNDEFLKTRQLYEVGNLWTYLPLQIITDVGIELDKKIFGREATILLYDYNGFPKHYSIHDQNRVSQRHWFQCFEFHGLNNPLPPPIELYFGKHIADPDLKNIYRFIVNNNRRIA